MVVVIFRSRLQDNASEQYAQIAKRMGELARESPGLLSFKSFSAPDGERVSIIEFESEEAVKAWRDHPEHVAAQRAGQASFYSEYKLQILSPVREYGWRRDNA